MTVTTYLGLFYGYVFKGVFLPSKLGQSFISIVCKPVKEISKKVINMKYFSISAYLTVLATFIIFVVIDSADDRRKLISAFGLLIFILLGAIFSKHPG
jgi:pyrimidine nucleoside transport protein